MVNLALEPERSARIHMPATSAPKASPVTTFRVRSICVFFFHCWSSTCRMKWICSGERPSLWGSILVANLALDSSGTLSAIPAACSVNDGCRNSPARTAELQMSYSLRNDASGLSVRCEICEKKRCGNEAKLNCVAFKWVPNAVINFKITLHPFRDGTSWNSAIYRNILNLGQGLFFVSGVIFYST